MSGARLLLTGTTGHLGSVLLAHVLRHGGVRGRDLVLVGRAVDAEALRRRNEAALERVLRAIHAPEKAGALLEGATHVAVPDLTVLAEPSLRDSATIRKAFESVRHTTALLENDFGVTGLLPPSSVRPDRSGPHRPCFGIHQTRQVRRVIHAAANTSFAATAEDSRRINVEGTRALIRALDRSAAPLDRFVYVGTAYSVGSNGTAAVASGSTVTEEQAEQRCRESGVDWKAHFCAYTATKLEAEQVLVQHFLGQRARKQCLPESAAAVLTIARPSIVIGHSEAGCAISGSIFFTARIVDRIGAVAWPLSARGDVVPADWVARALSLLAIERDRAPPHLIYQLSAGPQHATDWRQVAESFAAERARSGTHSGCSRCDPRHVTPMAAAPQHHYQQVDAAQIGRHSALLKNVDCCSPARTAYMLRLYARFCNMDIVFGHDRLLQLGVPPPPRFDTYLHRCLTQPADLCIAQQLAEDF